MSLKTDFRIAEQGNEEQKRLSQIESIRDKEQRENLRSMIAYRDDALKRETEKIEREIQKKAEEKAAEVKLEPVVQHRPEGMIYLSIEEQRAILAKAERERLTPDKMKRLAQFKAEKDRNIDKKIQDAQSLDKSRNQVRSTDPAVREKPRMKTRQERMQENARDITQKQGTSRGRSLKR